MKVLHVGIFDDHELGGDIVFEKGLKENGCLVTRFPYHPSRQIDESELPAIAKEHDLLFVGKGQGFSSSIFRQIRRNGTPIALWYGDIREAPEPWLQELMAEVDFFFMSSGGEVLRQYHKVGRPKLSAFYFNPVDPTLIDRFSETAEKSIEVLLTATNYSFAGPERRAVVNYLRRRVDVHLVGWNPEPTFGQRYFPRIFGRPRTSPVYRGKEYVDLIRRAKIGVGVNAYQSVPRYTSDRLQHYLTFGTFFMPWKFPQIELFFTYGEDLIWYEGVGDLAAKLDYYLREDQERQAIARASQRKVLTDYSAAAIIAMMLEIVRTGTSDRYSWVEIYR